MIIENQQDVTTAVLSELQRAPDARFKEIMSAFVRHLHEFVREVKLTGEVYSRWTVAISKLSRQFLVEILEQLPEERLVWRTIEGDVWFSGDATFDAIDKQQTRVDVTVHWKPVSAVERTAAALGLAGRAVRGTLEAFETYIESTGGPSGHSRIKVVSPKG